MSAHPIYIIVPNKTSCVVVENGYAIRGDLKAQGFKYLSKGVDGAIAPSAWVLQACDDDDAKEVATDLKTFVRNHADTSCDLVLLVGDFMSFMLKDYHLPCSLALFGKRLSTELPLHFSVWYPSTISSIFLIF